MKALVIGAGMMGGALAYDLANSEDVSGIILADVNEERAGSVAASIGPVVIPQKLDAGFYDDVVAVMRRADVAIGATTYNHNFLLTKAAIESGIHFCDLGGNMDVVRRQLTLHEQAERSDVCILPNCGLAPGMACVIAAGGAQRFTRVEGIHIRVGGLPKNPVPPLNYQLVFSAEGLINEYLEPAEAIRGGELKRVEPMADLEELEFPPPFGTLEAFNTSGGISTLPRMFDGKVKELDYKTIRYSGHCQKFKTLLDLGFASSEPFMFGNSFRTAREFFEELLRRKLPANGPDAVLMRVTIDGMMNGGKKTLAYEMVDYYDTRAKMTAMMRATSFPTSIIAQMVVKGTIRARGVVPPEQCVPLEPFLAELKKRNIIVKESLT